MLEKFVVNDDLYRSYALKICGCNDLKNDLVNDMYIKLDGILTKDPKKKIDNGYIFLMIRSIFIDGIRKNREIYVSFDEERIEQKSQNYDCYINSARKIYVENKLIENQDNDYQKLCQRMAMDETLNTMSFYDREILLKLQETSLRKLSKKVGIHYQTLHKEKNIALKKLKLLCQEKKEVLT